MDALDNQDTHRQRAMPYRRNLKLKFESRKVYQNYRVMEAGGSKLNEFYMNFALTYVRIFVIFMEIQCPK